MSLRRSWRPIGPAGTSLDAKPLIVVTTFNRKTFGRGIMEICAALRALATRVGVRIGGPVNPKPKGSEPFAGRHAENHASVAAGIPPAGPAASTGPSIVTSDTGGN